MSNVKKIKGYSATHKWVYRNFGKAAKCEKCGDIEKRLEWANISGAYK